jgi:3-hydroxyisobutyrate dehydrogenase-like beta-hydroxyacid dehydrogenase
VGKREQAEGEAMSREAGFIGLGSMGHPMASRLIAAGHPLRVWNRTASKAAGLAAQGATVVAKPAEAAAPGGIVFSMLADDQAVEEIFAPGAGLLERLGKGGVHVSMSTISPAASRRMAEQHARLGVAYLAAPVFGRPEAAQAGELWICLSGPDSAKERIKPMLAMMGQGWFDFGAEPGAANVVKLCGNFLIAAAIEALGEALALAEKNGLDRTRVIEMLTGTLFACPIYKGYGGKIAAQNYEPVGFRLALGLKDITLALRTAAESRAPMPLASLLHDRSLAAVAKGRGEQDWASLALEATEDAGLLPARAQQRHAG